MAGNPWVSVFCTFELCGKESVLTIYYYVLQFKQQIIHCTVIFNEKAFQRYYEEVNNANIIGSISF